MLQGIAGSVFDRVSEWHFSADEVELQPVEALPALDHPAALRATLRQLCEGLQVEGMREDEDGYRYLGWDSGESSAELGEADLAEVRFQGWVWTADMLRAHGTSMPELRQRGMRPVTCIADASFVMEDLGILTDELLTAAVEVGPQLRRLAVRSLAVQSEQHAGAPWPWEGVHMRTADITQLLRLPDPSGEGAPRDVWCSQLDIPSNVGEVSMSRCHETDVRQLCCAYTAVLCMWHPLSFHFNSYRHVAWTFCPSAGGGTAGTAAARAMGPTRGHWCQ